MYFNDSDKKCSYLSPFSDHPIFVDGIKFRSVYHYYTYHKFILTDSAWAKAVMRVKTTKSLIRIGNSRRHKIVPGWDAKKYKIMKTGYELKFQQHKNIKKKIMELKVVGLKYTSHPKFLYWGYYGKNMLGELLMELKKEYETKRDALLVPKPIALKVHVKPTPILKETIKPTVPPPISPLPVLKITITDTESVSDKFFSRPDNIKQVAINANDLPENITENYEKLKKPQLLVLPARSRQVEKETPVTVEKKKTVEVKEVSHKTKTTVETPEPELKELLAISLDSPDNKIENTICIPLAEMKAVAEEEVDDDTLINISKKLNSLSLTKNICLTDTAGWYSLILQNLRLAIAGKEYDDTSAPGLYVKCIMDRYIDVPREDLV